MTNGNSFGISAIQSPGCSTPFHFAFQWPIARHFPTIILQHSAQLHSIPRFSSSAEKRHRDVTIVHVQEACSYNCSFSFGPATIRSPDHQFGREAALCQPFCVDVPTIVRSASAVPAADIVGPKSSRQCHHCHGTFVHFASELRCHRAALTAPSRVRGALERVYMYKKRA